MRPLAQFVAVLLLVGFAGAYFWWIVAAAAVAGLAWLAVRVYPVARAGFEADARRRAEQAIALIQRADQQGVQVQESTAETPELELILGADLTWH